MAEMVCILTLNIVVIPCPVLLDTTTLGETRRRARRSAPSSSSQLYVKLWFMSKPKLGFFFT